MLVNFFPCPIKFKVCLLLTRSERYFCETNKGESHTELDQTLVSHLSALLKSFKRDHVRKF